MSKLGEASRDIFKKKPKEKAGKQPEKIEVKAETPSSATAEKGRPAELESWSKSTVILLERQSDLLDEICYRLKKMKKGHVTKSHLIRYAIDKTFGRNGNLPETEDEDLFNQLLENQ